jgi:phosphohistidine phosphatase
VPPVPDWFYRQSGTIPFRVRDGAIEVLLITSLSRRRWIIPKGVVEPGLTPEQSAAHEALEEAGVRGDLARPLGSYKVRKWEGICTITVFPMQVTEELETWPEVKQRERRWVSVDEACRLVQKPVLRALIRRLADRQ